MTGLNYIHNFDNKISITTNGDFNYVKNISNNPTIEELVEYKNNQDKISIGIKSDKGLAGIQKFNIDNFPNDSITLESGIDGIIITDLLKINKKISLILKVADCAGISFTDKTGNTLGLIHAGYSGTALDIIGNIFKSLEEVEDFSEYKFYIGPMIGEKFELEKKYYFKLFVDLFDRINSYGLDPDKYYQEISEEKGYLNLRKMILDIFTLNGIRSNQIIFSDIETNNPENNWPSYRINRTNKRIGMILEN